MSKFKKIQNWFTKRNLLVILAIAIGIAVFPVLYKTDWVGFGPDSNKSKSTEKTIKDGKIISTKETETEHFQSGKTVWDWLQLAGAIAIPVILFQFQRGEQKQADTNLREEVLQAYFDRMSVLLIDKELKQLISKNLETSDPQYPQLDAALDVARASTLSVLRRLSGDNQRQASVLRFLGDAELLPQLDLNLGFLNLDNVDLNSANLSRANLSGANLSRANLSGAKLIGVKLIGVNLFYANLSDANLSDANLSGAKLIGAKLIGVNLSRANLSDADLFYANLSDTNLSGAYLSDAKLSGAYLIGAYLSDANLSGANLSGAYLSGAYLSDANLSGAYLSGANLSGANLSGANLSGANLIGVNLSRANLSDADLFDANLSGANLPDLSKYQSPDQLLKFGIQPNNFPKPPDALEL